MGAQSQYSVLQHWKHFFLIKLANIYKSQDFDHLHVCIFVFTADFKLVHRGHMSLSDKLTF